MHGEDTNRRVIVIGGGPAGATAAYELAKRGFRVQVFEASPHIGGMARTFELWNQRVDLGPHRFFSHDKRINEVWLEVIGRDFRMVDRLTRVFYGGKFFYYPLKAFDALVKLGFWEACRCFLSYAHVRLSPPRRKDTFEDWVISRFGRRLFEIFFKSYSEKLWGISCRELDADFAAQRIKKLSLMEAVKGALGLVGGGKHKTLADRFAYPKGGSGEVYKRMLSAVERGGGQVHLKTPVKRVILQKGAAKGIELTDGTIYVADFVISTMPVTTLLAGLPDVPETVSDAAAQLRFRNTILVYLEVEGTSHFPDNWLYVQEPSLKTGRITNFRNWVPELCKGSDTTILAMEYWCMDSDPEWTSASETLVALATDELGRTKLTGAAKVLRGHVERVRWCYPIYRAGYKEHIATVARYLKGIDGLLPIGRYGSFKYNNQDHSILMGLMAADRISGQSLDDTWSVNTDYENYQEAAVIDETGLVTKETEAA